MPASPEMALFGVRWQAHPEELGGVHISFTYPVPSLRAAKEHVGGIQTVEVAASGQAGTGQGHHGGEDVQHTAGGSDRQTALARLALDSHWPCCGQDPPAPAQAQHWRPAPPRPVLPSCSTWVSTLQAAERPSGSAPKLCGQGLPGLKSQCCHLSGLSGLRFSVL